MSKIDLVSFWYSNSSIGMAPYVNTTADGGHIDYEGVYSKVDLETRIQSIMSALPDFFSSYTIKLTDVNLGGILVSKAECVLKASSSSEVPDYTDILTNINTNLSKLIKSFILPINAEFEEKFFQYFGFIYVYNNRFDYCYPSRSGNYLVISVSHNFTSKQDLINNRFSIANDYVSKLPLNSGYKRLSYYGVNYNVNPDSSSIDYTVIVLTGAKFYYDELTDYSDEKNFAQILSDINTTIDSKQDTTIVNNEVTPLAEINIDVPFEVKNLKKSDVEL